MKKNETDSQPNAAANASEMLGDNFKENALLFVIDALMARLTDDNFETLPPKEALITAANLVHMIKKF